VLEGVRSSRVIEDLGNDGEVALNKRTWKERKREKKVSKRRTTLLLFLRLSRKAQRTLVRRPGNLQPRSLRLPLCDGNVGKVKVFFNDQLEVADLCRGER
jgi:hypothetical protein